jgi:hypothetical protein
LKKLREGEKPVEAAGSPAEQAKKHLEQAQALCLRMCKLLDAAARVHKDAELHRLKTKAESFADSMEDTLMSLSEDEAYPR